MAIGGRLKGALARDPNMQRLSPGVYRNSKGQLINSGGRVMRRPTPQPQQQQAQQQDNSWAYQPYVPQQGQDMGQLVGQYPGGRPSPFEIGNQMADQMQNLPNEIRPNFGPITTYPGQVNGRNPEEIAGAIAAQPQSAINLPQMPQMPQPSANNGGRYRLSPGVYGTREQAMRQYQDTLQQAVGQSVAQGMPLQRRR